MTALSGWAPRGQRFVAKAPHGRWTTTTFVAALRFDRIDAPWLIDGPIDGESFRTYVERVLVPTLRPGDIVVMDNLGSHKGEIVRRADPRRRRQALLAPQILPGSSIRSSRCSPSSSTCFEKPSTRTVDAISTAIGEILRAFTPQECANYFRNSGYAQT